jgi:chromosome segregation ATPase
VTGPPPPPDLLPSTGPPPEPPPSAPSSPTRRRRLPVALAILVALLAAGVAVQQRQTAAGWQQRAVALEEQRDDARGRAEAFQRQLDEIADALAVSESDVAALEDRVRDLADEKAQAEDVATTTTVERDTLVALSSAVAGAVTSLDACVVELFDLLNEAIDAFNRQGAGEAVDVAPLNADRTATTADCNAARREAADAAARADRLLG